MKILSSPTKTFKITPTHILGSTPWFKEEAFLLAKKIQSLSIDELSHWMNISLPLATKTHEIMAEFSHQVAHPALFYYYGEVFKHLDASSLSQLELIQASSSLRILSAMYGVLRPFDGIIPYRMDFSMSFDLLGLPSGISFWKEKVNQKLFDEVTDNEWIINCASKEFSQLLDRPLLSQKARVLDIEFLDEIDGKLKIVSMYAKQARGKLLRILLKNPIQHIDDFRLISFDNYSFSDLSTANTIVFTRSKK